MPSRSARALRRVAVRPHHLGPRRDGDDRRQEVERVDGPPQRRGVAAEAHAARRDRQRRSLRAQPQDERAQVVDRLPEALRRAHRVRRGPRRRAAIAAQPVERQREQRDVGAERVQPARLERALLDEEVAALVAVQAHDGGPRARVVEVEARVRDAVALVGQVVVADRRQARHVLARPRDVDDAAVIERALYLPRDAGRRRLRVEGGLDLGPLVVLDRLEQRRAPIELDAAAQDLVLRRDDRRAARKTMAQRLEHRAIDHAAEVAAEPGDTAHEGEVTCCAGPSPCTCARRGRCRSGAGGRSSAPRRAASPPTARASPRYAGWRTAPGTCRPGSRWPGR